MKKENIVFNCRYALDYGDACLKTVTAPSNKFTTKLRWCKYLLEHLKLVDNVKYEDLGLYTEDGYFLDEPYKYNRRKLKEREHYWVKYNGGFILDFSVNYM